MKVRRKSFLPYEEAGRAARAAGLLTLPAYIAGYRAVPGLPSNPQQVYEEWQGWPAFIGHPRGPYLTLAEFITTVRSMGITSSTEYAQRYQESFNLPSNPYHQYPAFPGWRAVLENWAQPTRLRPGERLSFEAARAVVRAAGIQTSTEYLARRREYPGLPVRPAATYPEWGGWGAFLGTSGHRKRKAT